MTRAVAVVPARYNSQRLHAKPLADIAGKPMVQHVYERAARANSISRVIVATDDERIADAVRAFGGEAVITPRDVRSGTDRVALVAQALAGTDIIVNVQGDEPLLAPEMIDEGVALLAQSSAVAGTLVKRIENGEQLFNPNVVKVVLAADGNCLYFSRSPIPYGRDAEQHRWLQNRVYYKHIGMYFFQREFLLQYATLKETSLEQAEKLEQLRIIENGYDIKAAVTRYDSIPVDTPQDLERVRAIYSASYERG